MINIFRNKRLDILEEQNRSLVKLILVIADIYNIHPDLISERLKDERMKKILEKYWETLKTYA
jgi:hypothetical protein